MVQEIITYMIIGAALTLAIMKTVKRFSKYIPNAAIKGFFRFNKVR